MEFNKDTTIAETTCVLHIPLNKNPRKIISSKIPTKHMLITNNTISKNGISNCIPFQRFTLEIKKKKMKYA